MEVPFVSSGALSRSHYTLVRKIESATSIQSANHLLITEIKSRREQFSHAGLSLEQCKESLIILLYCHMTITHDYLHNDAFDFALPHAIGLAEAGQRLEQKRIGYLFCAEVMPPTHELQLMLVNTLRKDLESENIPQICLALDNVIVSYNEDLVPAIQARLHDLLSHSSLHVRRRALLAFYTLSRRNPELLTRISGTVMKRLEDPSQSVVSAALVLSLFFEAKTLLAMKPVVNGLLKKTLADPQGYDPWFLLRILQNLLSLGLTEENIPVVFGLVRSSSKPRIRAVLRGAFLLFSEIPVKFLLSSVESGTGSPVEYLRPLLTSGNPNDQYLFLACLECVDPAAWSGNSPGIPSVLEVWEVERVMQLLGSSDPLIRRTTLRLLNRIDANIVASYYSQVLQSIPSNLSFLGKNDHAVRMLELLEAKSGEDNEFYAQELINLLVQLEGAPPTGTPVLEAVVERVLLYLRNARIEFQVQIATTLLTSALESKSGLPQTLMVIVTALATEYCGKLSLSPVDMLRGLSARLPSCISSVQDACLLSMLRIAADCDEVPAQIICTVTELRQASKRHVRQRCEQFLTLIQQKPILSTILKSARSSSLPDFVEALYSQPTLSQLPQPSGTSQGLPSVSKLRYEAYDTPLPASKMRSWQASDVRDSPRLEADDSHAGSNSPSVTALASEKQQLKMMSKPGSPEVHTSLSPLALTQSSDDPTYRMDLIAFDSSSRPERHTTAGTNFERMWREFENRYSAQGWCDASVDNAVETLQNWNPQQVEVIPMDVPPFIGEVKVVMRKEWAPDSAVVRMKGTAENGSLWRIRSNDGELATGVKAILEI